MRFLHAWVGQAVLVCSALGCSPGAGADSAALAKYPPREPGCEIRTFPDAPSYPTDNIGPVRSSCDADAVSDADCLRTLKDAACKLGADTVWGIGNDAPTVDLGKKKFSGRAAHQK